MWSFRSHSSRAGRWPIPRGSSARAPAGRCFARSRPRGRGPRSRRHSWFRPSSSCLDSLSPTRHLRFEPIPASCRGRAPRRATRRAGARGARAARDRARRRRSPAPPMPRIRPRRRALDDPFPLELAVGLRHGVGVHQDFGGELADRGQAIALAKGPGRHLEAHLLADLFARGDATVGMDAVSRHGLFLRTVVSA